jgi:hypothetical protein
MSTIPKVLIRVGYRATLPHSADLGELLATRDTAELFVGQGAGKALVKIGVRTKYNFSGIGYRMTFINGTSVQSPVVGTSKVMVSSNVDCHIAWGPNPVATTSCTAILSRTPYMLTVGAGNKIAILPIVIGSLPTTYFYVNELL